MAIIASLHPEMVGHAAFVTACGCGPTTLSPETGFHHVTVHGVPLRITADLEYVVEQDLFVSRKLVDMEARKAMTATAYRVRAAYSTTRRESQVGDRRLSVYRKLRADPQAVIFLAKSRASGGKTPPPAMAISIIRYYVYAIGAEALGLDNYPEFLTLLEGIELLPNCDLNESLQGKFKKTDDSDKPADEGSDENLDVAEITRQRDEALAELKKLKKKQKGSDLEEEIKKLLIRVEALEKKPEPEPEQVPEVVVEVAELPTPTPVPAPVPAPAPAPVTASSKVQEKKKE